MMPDSRRGGDTSAALPPPHPGKALSPADAAPHGWDWTGLTCALLALTVWVICHPYRGIVHDNRIYALLALNYTDATTFARDLFLAHGSQDSFTFFSPLYAWAIGLLGLDWSNWLLTAAGQVLWVLCALQLIRRIVAPRFTWLALLFVAAYPPYYGGQDIFSFAEGFLTPRIFAEALGLAAIAAFLNGRPWLAVAALAIGAALHPLMMLAPAAVIVTMTLLRDRPWWWTVAFVTGGSALVLLAIGAAHMAGLAVLPTIDPQWRYVVEHRTAQLLLARWDGGNWFPIAADIIIVVLAFMTANPRIRQLLLTVLTVALASLAVSFVGFDLLGDLMVGKAQVWRALWLLHVLAPVSLALLVQDISARDVPERHIILTLAFTFAVVAAACFALGMPPFGISIAFLLGLLYVTVLTGGAYTKSRTRDVAMLWIGFAVLVLIFGAMMMPELLFSLREPGELLPDLLVPFIIVLAGVLLLSGFMRSRRKVLALAALGMLCLFLFRWDGRSEWRRYMDKAPDIASEVPVSLEPGDVVYWPTDVMALWGGLRHPSFYSDIQGAGAIFNRGTALEFLHRLQLVSRFEPNSRAVAALLGKESSQLLGMEADARLEDLVELCSHDERPDVIVLGQDVAGANGKPWRPKVPFSRVYVTSSDPGDIKPEDVVTRTFETYYVYTCRDLVRTD